MSKKLLKKLLISTVLISQFSLSLYSNNFLSLIATSIKEEVPTDFNVDTDTENLFLLVGDETSIPYNLTKIDTFSFDNKDMEFNLTGLEYNNDFNSLTLYIKYYIEENDKHVKKYNEYPFKFMLVTMKNNNKDTYKSLLDKISKDYPYLKNLFILSASQEFTQEKIATDPLLNKLGFFVFGGMSSSNFEKQIEIIKNITKKEKEFEEKYKNKDYTSKDYDKYIAEYEKDFSEIKESFFKAFKNLGEISLLMKANFSNVPLETLHKISEMVTESDLLNRISSN